MAEGPGPVHAALASRTPVECVVATDRHAADPALRALLARGGVPGYRVADSVMDGLQNARTPQGILALAERPPEADAAALGAARLVVGLWEVADPGNLGSILRTAEAAGADACLLAGDGVDPFHPRAVRASAGSVSRLPLRRMTSSEALAWSRGCVPAPFAARPRAETTLTAADLRPPCRIWLGNESHGLPEELLALCRGLRIPTAPTVESLAVSAAAAVVLFEARRQRDEEPSPP